MLKKLMVVLLVAVCLWQPVPAYAHGGGGGRGLAIASLAVGGAALLYSAGAYYRNTPAGYVVVQQPYMAAPAYPYPVYAVNGVPYYYPAVPNPYIQPAPVYAAPAAAAAPLPAPPAAPVTAAVQPAQDSVLEPFEVFLPNGNGSFTSVTLQKTDKGFLGPQGEFYPDHPAEEQLRERYLKK